MVFGLGLRIESDAIVGNLEKGSLTFGHKLYSDVAGL